MEVRALASARVFTIIERADSLIITSNFAMRQIWDPQAMVEQSDSPAAAEGWYEDPHGVHAHRWFSQGTPTKLVRDTSVELYYLPPEGPVPEN
jgi:hypothetical protein